MSSLFSWLSLLWTTPTHPRSMLQVFLVLIVPFSFLRAVWTSELLVWGLHIPASNFQFFITFIFITTYLRITYISILLRAVRHYSFSRAYTTWNKISFKYLIPSLAKTPRSLPNIQWLFPLIKRNQKSQQTLAATTANEESHHLQFLLKIAHKLDEKSFHLWRQQVEPYINAYNLANLVVCTWIPPQLLDHEAHRTSSVNAEHLDEMEILEEAAPEQWTSSQS